MGAYTARRLFHAFRAAVVDLIPATEIPPDVFTSLNRYAQRAQGVSQWQRRYCSCRSVGHQT